MLSTKTNSFFTATVHYLLADTCARYFAQKANVLNWLKEFILRTGNASHEPARLLTVAIVGEFKAGKSTLINAMLRREVAFVDAFEATTSVAIITPGPDEKVVIDDSAGNQKILSIAEFVAACRRYEMSGIDRLQMTVDHDIPLILIDTPGMGSNTAIHEERAEAAIMDSADLVLWVMDPSDMLSAKECAFLKRAHAIDLPVWCVLSKADELSDSDIEECIECVARTTGLDKKNILALSAHNQIHSGSDLGVNELLKRLERTCQQSADVRYQAEAAKITELLTELEKAVCLISASIKSEIDWIDDERAIFLQQAQIVKATLLRDTKSFLADSVAVYFTDKLPALIGSGASPDYICRTLIDGFSKETLPSVTERIASRVHEKAVAVWDESFEDRRADLSRQIEKLARNEMQDSDSEVFLRDQLVVTEGRREAIRRGFGSVPAAIGAGALTLLFDPTGITANLVTMGIGALVGHIAGKSAEGNMQETETQVNSDAVSDFVRRMSDTIVDQLLASEITRYIDQVVEQALDERCQQRESGAKECDVLSTQEHLNRISDGLKSIRSTGDPGYDLPNILFEEDNPSQTSNSDEMNVFASEPRLQLMRIVQEHGIDICQSPRQVEGLLKDLCGDYSKEVFLLALCLSAGFVSRIISLKGKAPEQSLILAGASELSKSKGIELNAATWALESWNEALSTRLF